MLNCPDFYYDDINEDPFNPKDELIHSCKQYVRDIVHHLYNDEPLDRIALDGALQDICNLLEIQFPTKLLTVERKKGGTFFSNFDAKSLYANNKTI